MDCLVVSPRLMDSTPQPELGRRLRESRLAAGRSLAEVSEATDISPSFLSMVEKGTSDLSIGRLMRLTHYYGVDIAEVVHGSDESAPRSTLTSAAEGFEIEFLADSNLPLRPSLATFQPGGGTLEPVNNIGDAFVYVLSGELTLEVDDEPPRVLREGEGVYLRREQMRTFHNRGATPARVLSVLLRPT